MNAQPEDNSLNTSGVDWSESRREPFLEVEREVPRRALLGDLAVFLAWLGVIIVALILTPDARGYGTHQQLGFPPCTMMALTERPCPSCGLTTCFTAMAQFRFGEAFSAHPLGPFLFLYVSSFALYSLSKFVFGYRLRLPRGLPVKINVALLAVFMAYGVWRWFGGV